MYLILKLICVNKAIKFNESIVLKIEKDIMWQD